MRAPLRRITEVRGAAVSVITARGNRRVRAFPGQSVTHICRAFHAVITGLQLAHAAAGHADVIRGAEVSVITGAADGNEDAATRRGGVLQIRGATVAVIADG